MQVLSFLAQPTSCFPSPRFLQERQYSNQTLTLVLPVYSSTTSEIEWNGRREGWSKGPHRQLREGSKLASRISQLASQILGIQFPSFSDFSASILSIQVLIFSQGASRISHRHSDFRHSATPVPQDSFCVDQGVLIHYIFYNCYRSNKSVLELGFRRSMDSTYEIPGELSQVPV
ncbi:hypothetical protein LXL04_019848 [Taraxacum kok-saghyz]